MTVTEHAISRFQERITSGSRDEIVEFVLRDIQKSTLLYSINHIQKKLCDGVVYVIDSRMNAVITLYLQ